MEVGGVIRIKNLRTRQSVYLNARDIEIATNLVMAHQVKIDTAVKPSQDP